MNIENIQQRYVIIPEEYKNEFLLCIFARIPDASMVVITNQEDMEEVFSLEELVPDTQDISIVTGAKDEMRGQWCVNYHMPDAQKYKENLSMVEEAIISFVTPREKEKLQKTLDSGIELLELRPHATPKRTTVRDLRKKKARRSR